LERVENSLKKRSPKVNKYRKRTILQETKEYPVFNIMFTATLGNRHSEIWRSRLLVQFDENVFLFHGVVQNFKKCLLY